MGVERTGFYDWCFIGGIIAGFIVSRIRDDPFESLLFNNFNSDLRVLIGTMEKFASGRKRKLPENEIG